MFDTCTYALFPFADGLEYTVEEGFD